MSDYKIVCTDINTDREKNPLMKELHELGLKYGVKMVVATLNYENQFTGTLCIDHEEESKGMEVAMMFGAAGYYLLEAAKAVAVYAHEKGERLEDVDL